MGWDHQEKLQLHESQKGKTHHTLSKACIDALIMSDDVKLEISICRTSVVFMHCYTKVWIV